MWTGNVTWCWYVYLLYIPIRHSTNSSIDMYIEAYIHVLLVTYLHSVFIGREHVIGGKRGYSIRNLTIAFSTIVE